MTPVPRKRSTNDPGRFTVSDRRATSTGCSSMSDGRSGWCRVWSQSHEDRRADRHPTLRIPVEPPRSPTCGIIKIADQPGICVPNPKIPDLGRVGSSSVGREAQRGQVPRLPSLIYIYWDLGISSITTCGSLCLPAFDDPSVLGFRGITGISALPITPRSGQRGLPAVSASAGSMILVRRTLRSVWRRAPLRSIWCLRDSGSP